MKTCSAILASVVLLLMVSMTAAPQDTNQHKGVSAKVVTIVGKISADAKRLIADKHHGWTVSNPDALTGHEGHLVTVTCRISPDRTNILVLSVVEHLARVGDSAFRR